jgi:hypothetical protein
MANILQNIFFGFAFGGNLLRVTILQGLKLDALLCPFF